MPNVLTCPGGHQWPAQDNGAGGLVCPVCGAAARLTPGAKAVTVPGAPTLAPSNDSSLLNGPESATLSPSAVRAAMVAGAAVPGYEILEVLGRGGMGVVYKARQTALNRIVALKMVLAGMHAGPDDIARFRREAQAIARIQHPNIVQIYEVGSQHDLPYFSMEYVDGGSLADQLDGKPWPAKKAGALVHALARAIHAAHLQNIVHRDLKPANILMMSGGMPKITDFGLVKKLDDGKTAHTRTGAILGTPSYMAPEQAGGKKDIGPTADVYGLGAILYELLTGRPPFQAASHLDTILLVLTEEPVPPSRLRANVDRDLETICLKCLQKDPEKRYPSAAALANDLRRFRIGDLIRARKAGLSERVFQWMKRRPMTMSLTTVVVAAILILAFVVMSFRVQVASKDQDARDRIAEKERELQAAAEREQTLGKERDLLRSSLREANEKLGEAKKTIDFSKNETVNETVRLKKEIEEVREREKKLRDSILQEVTHLNDESWTVAKAGDKSPDAYQNALRLAELATRFDPTNANCMITKGAALFRLGKFAEAREALLKSEKINAGTPLKSPPAALAFQAMSAQRLAKKAEAVQYLESLRDLVGGPVWGKDPEARALLKEAESLIDPDAGKPQEIAIPKVSRPVDYGAHWADRPDTNVNVLGIAFTTDAHRLLVGGDIANVPEPNLWLLNTEGNAVTRMTTFVGHKGWVNHVVVSGDAKTALSGSQDGTAILWDVTKHQPIKSKSGAPLVWKHDAGVGVVAISPDGKVGASASGNVVSVLDFDGNSVKLRFSQHPAEVTTVSLTPDGKQIISTDRNQNLFLWDRETGQVQDRLTGCYCAAVSPDGNWIASGGDNRLWLWDRSTGVKWRLRGEQKNVFWLNFSPDSQRLLVTDRDGRALMLWDVGARKQICRIPLPAGDTLPNRAVVGPDNKSIACGVWRRHLYVWRLSN